MQLFLHCSQPTRFLNLLTFSLFRVFLNFYTHFEHTQFFTHPLTLMRTPTLTLPTMPSPLPACYPTPNLPPPPPRYYSRLPNPAYFTYLHPSPPTLLQHTPPPSKFGGRNRLQGSFHVFYGKCKSKKIKNHSTFCRSQ